MIVSGRVVPDGAAKPAASDLYDAGSSISVINSGSRANGSSTARSDSRRLDASRAEVVLIMEGVNGFPQVGPTFRPA